MADRGATVLRVDRTHPTAYTDSLPPATDCRQSEIRRRSCSDHESPSSGRRTHRPVPTACVGEDGFGPRESAVEVEPERDRCAHDGEPEIDRYPRDGLPPSGKYKDMTGHNIIYITISGVLSMLGRKGEMPYAPGNIVGDFAGGGAVCFMGILLAPLQGETWIGASY